MPYMRPVFDAARWVMHTAAHCSSNAVEGQGHYTIGHYPSTATSTALLSPGEETKEAARFITTVSVDIEALVDTKKCTSMVRREPLTICMREWSSGNGCRQAMWIIPVVIWL